MRKFHTTRFGDIEAEDEKIVQFAQGIPAFEEEHEFLIIPYDEASPYLFLQSLATPDLAFLMTVPFVFFPTYEFNLDDDIIASLGIKAQEDLLIYSLITIPDKDIKQMTANLLAPVIINRQNMQARQVVLERTQYHTKHKLFPEAADAAKEGQ